MNLFNQCSIDRTPCVLDTEYIRVHNNHNNPYRFFVDDASVTIIPANDIFDYYVEVGRHSKWFHVKLVQESDFDSIPHIYEDTLIVDPCIQTNWWP